jgi:hypothetical protein
MATKHPLRLALSPLTNTIYAGRLKERKGYAESVGDRHDVTSDFFQVLIQLAIAANGIFTVNQNGEPAYEVTVKKIESAPSNKESSKKTKRE